MTFSWLLEVGDLDWLAIVLGAVAAMALGALWYGPVFGKLWSSKSGVGRSGGPVQIAMTGAYCLVFNMALQYLGLATVKFEFEHALVAGIVLGVLAIGPALYSSVVWAKKHTIVFFIDLGFWFVVVVACLLVQSIVL
ncbi:MAG: DUF1761 domain-containing protein [Actinomycetota bacterium]